MAGPASALNAQVRGNSVALSLRVEAVPFPPSPRSSVSSTRVTEPRHTQLIMPGSVRLDRSLSKLGLASRADARRVIEAGEVRVSGRIVRDPSLLVRPGTTAIEIGGKRSATVKWRTIALHKPRAVLTTRRDPEGRRTVFDAGRRCRFTHRSGTARPGEHRPSAADHRPTTCKLADVARLRHHPPLRRHRTRLRRR